LFNFEYLLHVIEEIESLRNAWSGAAPSRTRVVEAMFADGPPDDLRAAFDPYFAAFAHGALLDAIHDAAASASNQASWHPNWKDFQLFWRSLDETFDLGVITLNYDTLLEHALNITARDQGFELVPNEHVWRFSERALPPRPKLMHLHGSIHFGDREHQNDPNRFTYEDEWEDVYWHSTPQAAKASRVTKNALPSQAGARMR